MGLMGVGNTELIKFFVKENKTTMCEGLRANCIFDYYSAYFALLFERLRTDRPSALLLPKLSCNNEKNHV